MRVDSLFSIVSMNVKTMVYNYAGLFVIRSCLQGNYAGIRGGGGWRWSRNSGLISVWAKCMVMVVLFGYWVDTIAQLSQ